VTSNEAKTVADFVVADFENEMRTTLSGAVARYKERIPAALKHSVHHRGQLSTYLRPMGGTVPGIYGPSADTQ
jgi:uncharacterized damage-inducible protein DinB